MATTIKYIIREERPRPDGSFPIRIRITHNRKIKYLPTPWCVEKPGLIDPGFSTLQKVLKNFDFNNFVRFILSLIRLLTEKSQTCPAFFNFYNPY